MRRLVCIGMLTILPFWLALGRHVQTGTNFPINVPQKPIRFDDLPKYLESLLPPEAKGRVNLTGGYVECYFTIGESADTENRALKFARDFIVAAYDSSLPIKGAKIVIMQSAGKAGISISLGSNVAAEYRQEIASASSLNPRIFVQWMKTVSSRNGERLGVDQVHVEGLWAELKQSSNQRRDTPETSATSNASLQQSSSASNEQSDTNRT